MTEALIYVVMVLFNYMIDVYMKFITKVFRHDGCSVLPALATADKDIVLAEIYILDTEPDTFHEAQA